MLSKIISRVRQTLTEPTKQTYTGKYNGKPHKYRLTNCVRCKEEKMIHGFTDVCSDCKKKEKAEKYYKKHVNPIHREPVIAKLPTGIEVKAPNMRTLKRTLNLEWGMKVPKDQLQKTNSHSLEDGTIYWYYKSIVIMYKKDYSEDRLLEIVMKRLNKENPTKGKPKPRKVTPELREKILQIVNLKLTGKYTVGEIADKVGMKKAMVNHIITGRSYGHVSGITYKRAYNKYGEGGDVELEKERVALNYKNRI